MRIYFSAGTDNVVLGFCSLFSVLSFLLKFCLEVVLYAFDSKWLRRVVLMFGTSFGVGKILESWKVVLILPKFLKIITVSVRPIRLHEPNDGWRTMPLSIAIAYSLKLYTVPIRTSSFYGRKHWQCLDVLIIYLVAIHKPAGYGFWLPRSVLYIIVDMI